MARLEIDLSAKGFTQGKRNIDNVTASLEKLDDTIRLVDFDKLSKSLNGLSGSFRVTTGDINNNKTALDKEKLAQQQHRTETSRLQSEIVKLRLAKAQTRKETVASSGSYREAQQRLTALGKSIREAKGGFTSTSPAIQNQIAQYRALNEQLKAFDKQMGLNYRNVGNYGSAFNSLGAISPQLSMLASKGGGFIGVGLAARDAYRTVSDFDSGLKNVQKTTGLTSQEVAKLGEEFVSLSKRLQTVSAKDLTQYATVAGQLGVKGTQNILNFAEALAKLETASDITGEEGGADIARLLTLTDGGVQNIKRFTDEIVNLGNNFPATEAEILKNATRIAQATGVYKLGRENVLAYATATKSVGVEAELVGSSIGRTLGIIEKLSRSTKGAEQITKLLGISQAELQTRFRENSGQVLTDFIGALQRIDKAGGSVNGTLESLGIRAIRDKTVLGSLATNGFDVLTSAIDKTRDSLGAADEEFETASSKIEKQIGRIGIAWDNLILGIENGTGVIGNVSVAFADVTASILDGFSNIVTSSSWKEFFARMGELSGMASLRVASKAAGDAIRAGQDNPNGRPRTDLERAVARSVRGFDQASTEEQALRLREQRAVVEARAQEYRARGDKENLERLTLQNSILAEMNKIYYAQLDIKKKIEQEDNKPKGPGSGGKSQADLIREANEALSKGQVGALNGIDAELLKIDNKYDSIFKKINLITDATTRGQLAAIAQTNKELEISNTRLDAWLKTYKKSNFGATGVTSVTGQITSTPLYISAEEQAGFYSRTGRAKIRAQFGDKDLEKRLGRVVERGLRRGIDGIFQDIDDLGSNFYEVFSNTFGKLATTITNTFGQVLSTQLGDLLSKRINSGDFSIGGLSSNASKALVAGGGLLGGILSAQGASKANTGLSVAGGALSGAAAGLAFGPVGAAIGGVIGAIKGIFSSSGAKKAEKQRQELLAEQRKQTALAERQAALAFQSSIVGQMTNQGIVSGVSRSAFGDVEFIIQGKTLKALLAREDDSR